MTTIILYRRSRLSILARLTVTGGSAFASGRLRAHRINARFFQQPETSHRSSFGSMDPAHSSLRPALKPRRLLTPRPFAELAESISIARRPRPRRAASFNRFLCAIPRRIVARARLRCCGTAQRDLCIARKDFTQQISKKASIGGLRTKNYSNDAFPGGP